MLKAIPDARDAFEDGKFQSTRQSCVFIVSLHWTDAV